MRNNTHTVIRMGFQRINNHRNSFTLLELVVAMAVVSLLGAVAVPLMYNALIHTRVAKTQQHLCILRESLEMYAVDYGRYPVGSTSPTNSLYSDFDTLILFRPLLCKYLPADSSIIEDDFSRETMSKIKTSIAFDPQTIPDVVGFSYFDYENYHVPPWSSLHAFALVSVGPDAIDSGLGIAVRNPPLLPDTIYAPSNGIRSRGDIGITNARLGLSLF